MKFYYLSVICCIPFAVLAQTTFNDLNDALQRQHYSYILGVFEQEQQPNIIKKRLLARMLKQWNNLSPAEQRRSDALVAQLMPADRMVLGKIKKRSIEIDTKKAYRTDTAEEAAMAPWQEDTPAITTPTIEAPPTIEKKPAPKKQQQKPTPKKSAPPTKTKKITPKKPAPKKQMPKKKVMPAAEPVVAPAPKVIIKEVPAPTPVRDEL